MLLKKYLYVLPLLSVMMAALPLKVAADDVIVGDDDGTGKITAVTLVWDANRESDIAGYNVYYGRTSGDYVRIVSVVQPTVTIKVRGSATTYFAATAYNTNDQESALSEEVHWP
jgi:hypothetical protein